MYNIKYGTNVSDDDIKNLFIYENMEFLNF